MRVCGCMSAKSPLIINKAIIKRKIKKHDNKEEIKDTETERKCRRINGKDVSGKGTIIIHTEHGRTMNDVFQRRSTQRSNKGSTTTR